MNQTVCTNKQKKKTHLFPEFIWRRAAYVWKPREDEDVSENAKLAAEMYWSTDSDGNFIFDMTNSADVIAESIFYPRRADEIWKNISVADIPDFLCGFVTRKNNPIICRTCGDYIEKYTSREELPTRKLYNRIFASLECDDCKTLKSDRLNDECARAYTEDRHKTLSDLEFNFLKALFNSDNRAIAAKTVGVSESYSQKLFEKLLLKKIVYIGDGGYTTCNELIKWLSNIDYKKSTKKIFMSENIKKLYRELKNKYFYVFPEVAVSAFIDKNTIDDILDEQWKKAYYFNSRVDFLLCDEDSRPVGVVEYNGGYHEDESVKKKDDLKRQMCEKCGLMLEVVTGYVKSSTTN